MVCVESPPKDGSYANDKMALKDTLLAIEGVFYRHSKIEYI